MCRKVEGSPPHARGRHKQAPVWLTETRITPACAGKTSGADRGAQRTCGSPPHARGRQENNTSMGARRRITPACAGKTRITPAVSPRNGDHPRMRGEDRQFMALWNYTDGSPPHARGRRREHLAAVNPPGITPACAGKTSGLKFLLTTRRDHPRMRGEDASQRASSIRVVGSPPHARGRLLRQGRTGFDDGITPACAGKTSNPLSRRTPRWDHPRMRGEDLYSAQHRTDGTGSPPHARGRRKW